jgi:hypothetical protein
MTYLRCHAGRADAGLVYGCRFRVMHCDKELPYGLAATAEPHVAGLLHGQLPVLRTLTAHVNMFAIISAGVTA